MQEEGEGAEEKPRKIPPLRKEENVEMESAASHESFPRSATLRRVQCEGNCHGVRLHEDSARVRPRDGEVWEQDVYI